MAAELVTPLDSLSGMPLSVAPPLQPLPRNNPNVANWHHLYHPRDSAELHTVGGCALRNSRVQLLLVRDHNVGRHTYHTYFKGPVLPQEHDEDAQFSLIVLACGGYLPQEVIDISGDEPKVRQMTNQEYDVFRLVPKPRLVGLDDVRRYRIAHGGAGVEGNLTSQTNREVLQRLNRRNKEQAKMGYNNFRYAYEPIRDFFQQYAIKQPLGHISEIYIDEFLFTEDIRRRNNLGHWLLAKQSEVASERVEEVYSQARKMGALHPLMPRHANDLVKHKLGDVNHRLRLLDDLRLRLLGNLEATGVTLV